MKRVSIFFLFLFRLHWIACEEIKDIGAQIFEKSKEKVIEQFQTISFDDVKNFVSTKVDTLKKIVIDQVLKDDVERFTKASIKRYTVDAPKNLSAKASNQSYEADFLYNSRYGRLQKALNQLEKITGLIIKNREEMPRIALAFSGGGYRALTLTAGYMKAFEELGILDAALYIVGLSGSTWYMAPWIFLQDPQGNKSVSAAQYYDEIIQKIENNTFDPFFSSVNVKTFSRQRFANDVILPKLVFSQPIGIPDIFGAALAHAWFGSAPFEAYVDRQQRMRLSNQRPKVMDAKVPWPIYTSVSMHKTNGSYRYNWYEFNPEEVRNLEYGLYLPAYAFGRQFEAGQSKGTEFDGKTYFAPEQSFGYLMGIFGSAYTVNLIDLYRMYLLPGQVNPEDVNAMQQSEQTADDLVEAIKKGDTKTANSLASRYFNPVSLALATAQLFRTLVEQAKSAFIEVGKLRIAPAQVFNPFYKYADPEVSASLTNRDTITFVDGGIHYNIPLRPLFLPERKIDLIFVGDASSSAIEDLTAETSKEMAKAFADIERMYGVLYSRDGKISDKTMHVYRPDPAHPKAPVIVYFNFWLDDQLIGQQELKKYNLKGFDIKKCLGEFCSTFNFSQNKGQFIQLSSLGYLNVMAHKDKILTNDDSIIKERFAQEENWWSLGESTGQSADEIEENLTQKDDVPDIEIPASDVTIPVIPPIPPEILAQEMDNVIFQLDQLRQQLADLLDTLQSLAK